MSRRPAAALVAGVLSGLVLAGCASRPSSPVAFLREAWRDYVDVYVAPAGYVLDRTRGGGEVVSEAQGYALLRAAWIGDADTFDRVFAWTERTLRRPDGLYSWRWTPADGGRVLDANTATDADQEIALALVLAARFLDRPWLTARAAELLRAIRAHEAIDVAGGWLPAAGNWAVGDRVVNPSYFLPYAYPAFAPLDPTDDWPAALDAGYRLLAAIRAQPGASLPPDFVVVEADGAVAPLPAWSTLGRDFSFDAMRLWFRVAVDCRLTARAAACADPLDVAGVAARLARGEPPPTRSAPDGTPRTSDTSLSFLGSLLPALDLVAPDVAARVRSGPLSPAALRPILRAPDRYYDLNWVWFGLAVAQGFPFTPCPTS